MNVQDIVDNELVQDESSVWHLKGHHAFAYSDGAASEKYLEHVFRTASDLSSNSSELEQYIKDWPSEYHLTPKRAQLFSGFQFDPQLCVLEVGCGCGAITRYLGETFSRVVSIEGSAQRARLARLRTRDLNNVSIICSPFQDLHFSQKFDVIFCIGVYEYSASFVDAEKPYDAVLEYFSDLLKPDGFVVIAIENQFGLKYFNASREDHTGKRYEGLEGYHLQRKKVRTFGKSELEQQLRKFFPTIAMYYPFPDYKLPSHVISEAFLSTNRAGELVSQIESRDYYGKSKPLWVESLVILELSRNAMLPFFSNSFLAVAGKSELTGISFDQLAIMNNVHRTPRFRTTTTIVHDLKGDIVVSKKLNSGETFAESGKLKLVESKSRWRDTDSLHTVLYKNGMSRILKLDEMFSPCKSWISFLEAQSEIINGSKYLEGRYVDCIFSNAFVEPDGVVFVDEEWVWHERISMNVIVIRALFTFICSIDRSGAASELLRVSGVQKLIVRIASTVGVRLSGADFRAFVALESELQSLVNGSARVRNAVVLRWILRSRRSLRIVQSLKTMCRFVNLRAAGALSRLQRLRTS